MTAAEGIVELQLMHRQCSQLVKCVRVLTLSAMQEP
jgi:hypothetical protein